MKTLCVILLLCASLAFGQTATSLLDGNVTDPQGAAVVGAEVAVINADTGATFKATTDQNGRWLVPSMSAGVYRVTIATKGFRTTVIEGVKIDAGVPTTANARLELGQLTETVSVEAGAELIQATNATVNSTIQGRQVFELPFTSRNALETLVTQPGTQTGTTPRNSFINGLPWAAINVTTDGINTQDNYYKSGDGFFTLIPVRPDSVEEITLSTSAASADSLGQGAAQVKFITKGGTNTYHGGAFWQHRNTALNANYYFNNINGQPRDRLILNQGGVHVGGPIKKNKLFFFTNYEIYRYPGQTSTTRTVLAPSALDGTFTYIDSTKAMRKVNVLQLAAANGYVGTQDPILQKTFTQIDGLTKNGIIKSRVPTSNDYNRNDLFFQPSGMSKSTLDTTRLDYNISDKHHLGFVWTYYLTDSTPDITNSVVPIYPGTGTVLGFDSLVAGQRGNRYSGVVSLRSSFTPMMTNEFRGGMNRAVTLFRDQVSSPSLFSQWRGYSPSFSYLTGVAAVSGSSRRNSPVKELHDNVSWVKGQHLLSFGGDFTQINFWYQSVGTAVIPTISFAGIQSTDPAYGMITGGLPNSTSTDQSNARYLYAILTGRVYSITRSMVLDENTHQYGNVPQVDRNRQREWGAFLQDTWKLTPSLTLNLGLRFEQQRPFENINGTYSSVSNASIWGISGVGNMFKPGTLSGVVPTFDKLGQAYTTPNAWNPSISLAWQLPGANGGPISWLFGSSKGKSVLRAGYAISTIREGTYVFQNIYGSNYGVTAGTSVDPANYPTQFGAAGSVLFRDPSLPVRTVANSPQFPITPAVSDSLNAFDPSLKMPYVQSWNIGFQRELTRDTVMEVRYTGNHGVKLWRQVNLNEINVFENGFLNEVGIAQKNLAIARGCAPTDLRCAAINSTTNNYGNQGLPGQGNIPMMQTAIGNTTDSTTATSLVQNRPGSIASSIATTTSRLASLTKAGYPANLFQVNPTVASGGTYLVTNLGSSSYNALQVELRRRMSAGLLFQGSYAWAHSISMGAMDQLNDYNNPTTFRNLRLDRVPMGSDIRHAFKFNSIYELPIGPGRRFLNARTPVLSKLLEGWQITGVSRAQSGTPFQMTSNRSGMNTSEAGVVLNNLTASELQDMMQIRKVTASNGQGQVYYLPQSFIDNTNAAFEVNGKTLKDLDPTKPYIGPQMAPGQFGYRIYLRNPWQYHLDMSVVKHTRIRERADVEFRVQALDVLNLTNFFLANTSYLAAFGQTTSAYRDFSGSSDPGARIIEFVLRINF